MINLTYRYRCLFSYFAATYTFLMVCLIESRPPSVGVVRNGADLSAGNQSSYRNGGILLNSSPFYNDSKRRKEDMEIITFPSEDEKEPSKLDPVRPKIKPFFEVDKSAFKACAKDESYCTKIDNYPVHVEDLLAKNIGQFQGLFGVDKVVTDLPVANRIHIDDFNESPLCASKERIIFPKVAQNEKQMPVYIINPDNVTKYQQGVNIVECGSKSGNCDLSNSFPNGYRTSCKQKYMYRRLVALNSNGQPYQDFCSFPSCCVCVRNNIISRIGFTPRSDTTPVQRTTGENGPFGS